VILKLISSFAAAVSSLMADGCRREALGESARAFVREERSLAQAAIRLREVLAPEPARAPA